MSNKKHVKDDRLSICHKMVLAYLAYYMAKGRRLFSQ
jgi:hypothetical protein